MLLKFFPRVKHFARETERCTECLKDLNLVAAVHEEKRELAHAQKAAINDILNERNRPTWAKAALNKVYLIPRR
jgi:hypothetical protein